MSRVLVIHASHYGQTFAIAERIAQRLRDLGHDVDLGDAHAGVNALPPPEDYDAVVLGSRVEVGRHASALLAYIRQHRAALRRMPTGFFSVSMAAARPDAGDDPSGYIMNTLDQLEWHPTETASFAGALLYRRYGWLMRMIMKRIARSAGHTTDTSRNHVFTDFAKVDAFAARVGQLVAHELTVEPIVHV